MVKYKLAHVKAPGGVDVVVVPLDASFEFRPSEEQTRVFRMLQQAAGAAGLKGTVVPVWENSGGKFRFMAERALHPYFQTLSIQVVRSNLNRELTIRDAQFDYQSPQPGGQTAAQPAGNAYASAGSPPPSAPAPVPSAPRLSSSGGGNSVEAALEMRDKVAAFQRKHRVGLLTMLFTDMVGSTKLKQQLGDQEAVGMMQQHHSLVRNILGQFPDGEEISTAGDSFFIVFAKPSDAAKFAVLLQNKLRDLAASVTVPLADRIGIHVGEVMIEERAGSYKPKDLYGLQVDISARVMSLGEGNQILLTRSAYDNARQVLKGQEIDGLSAPLIWINHGYYNLKGVEDPLEICEVGEEVLGVLKAPEDSEKVQRAGSTGQPTAAANRDDLHVVRARRY